MKRRVERSKKLPAFSVDIAELERLWARVNALFDEDERIDSRISITLPAEEIEFKSIDELKECTNLAGRITNFDLALYQNNKTVTIRGHFLLYSQYTVSATGDNEAWCAGAVETVYLFFQSHRVWYHWLVVAPIGWMLIIFMNMSAAILTYNKGILSADKTIVVGWTATLITLTFLFAYRKKLLPPAIIVITEEEGFIKKHSAELALIIALVSLLLTGIGLFISGKSS